MTKKDLRKELISRRKSMEKSYRVICDQAIYNKLIACPEIAAANTVLVYVSTEIEVDTIRFIKEMLHLGKTVAVPKCEGKNMRFIKIDSLDSLKKGAFGIYEPENGEEITNFSDAVCITPALSFNEKGYRLGYGGGFYDRFAEKFDGISVGICYESFIGAIPLEEFDRPIDILVTDEKIRYIHRNEV